MDREEAPERDAVQTLQEEGVAQTGRVAAGDSGCASLTGGTAWWLVEAAFPGNAKASLDCLLLNRYTG